MSCKWVPVQALVAAALFVCAPLAAQQADTAPPKPAPDKSEKKAEAPARPAASDRVFVPSEEVSPDQEVDFPADI